MFMFCVTSGLLFVHIKFTFSANIRFRQVVWGKNKIKIKESLTLSADSLRDIKITEATEKCLERFTPVLCFKRLVQVIKSNYVYTLRNYVLMKFTVMEHCSLSY